MTQRVELLCGDPIFRDTNTVAPLAGIYKDTLVAEKLIEMYSIFQTLEEYLKYNSLDGKQERQPLRKKLQEMLNNL